MPNCDICHKELDSNKDVLSVNVAGTCVECMATAPDPDELFHVIEILIAEAYEIGHAHASNAYTAELRRVDDGWGPLAVRLFQVLAASGYTSPRSQDLIEKLKKEQT